jgi:F420-dependent oxidoreductase-like protein
MLLDVHVVRFPWTGGPGAIRAGLIRTARAVEAVGANGLSFMDHFFGPPERGPAEDPMLDGYTALGFVACATERVRLRLLVTGVTYRHPGLLAKAVTTLDVLSAGRSELGIGAAWYEREHRGLGVPFPPLHERFERLEEAVLICKQMWSDDNGPFEGRHFQLAETICSPVPVSRPRPPILIGGSGEQKTLALVARHADACNVFAASAAVVGRKLAVLRDHCEKEGRPYDSVRKTIVYRGPLLTAGKHDEFLEEMAGYAALGVEEVFVLTTGPDPCRWIEDHCTPVITRLAQLG